MKKGEMVAYHQVKMNVMCRRNKLDLNFAASTQFRKYGSPRGRELKRILRAVVEGSAQ
jgi:hypothetical protein